MRITKHGKIGGALYRGVEMYRGKRLVFFGRSIAELLIKSAQWKQGEWL